MRAASAVEPTRSGEHHGNLAALGVLNLQRCRWRRRRFCAFGDRFQQPLSVAQRGDAEFFHVASVSLGEDSKSMSFSAKRWAYCPRPSFSSQSATCLHGGSVPHIRLIRPDRQLYTTNPRRGREGLQNVQPSGENQTFRFLALSHINRLSAVEPVLDVRFDLLALWGSRLTITTGMPLYRVFVDVGASRP